MDTNELRPYSLLIVDDDELYRENLNSIFERHFGTIFEAPNGASAFTLYQDERPDIIITDISMPTLDGLSLIKKIRADDLKTKIIVTSGHTEQHYLLDAIPLHISRFIVKPFEFSELLQAILESLEEENTKEDVVAFRHQCDGSTELQCSLNRQNRTITCDGETHDLSLKEFLLLNTLIENGNRVVSYDMIEDLVWEGEYMSSNALRTLIKKVRQKTCKNFIKNVASLGYRVDIIPATVTRR